MDKALQEHLFDLILPKLEQFYYRPINSNLAQHIKMEIRNIVSKFAIQNYLDKNTLPNFYLFQNPHNCSELKIVDDENYYNASLDWIEIR